MEKDLIIADTNIVIEILKNNPLIIEQIDSIGLDRLAISSITLMELLYGALNKKESKKIKKNLEAFELIHFDHDVSRLAVDLIERYALSHKLNLPDAVIAAIAINHNLELFTLNLKDFRYIEGLALWAPGK